jgi:hypothetical protein
MKKRSGNISPGNAVQLLLAFVFLLLFGGLLYQFIEFLDLKILLNNKIHDLDHCLNQLEQIKTEEGGLKTDLKGLEIKLHDFAFPYRLKLPENDPPQYLPYDLRDTLLLSKSSPDSEVMKQFKMKWQVTSSLYETCGIVTSIPPLPLFPPLSSTHPCRLAIISSWFPRPCGIATHSHMLLNGLHQVCPPLNSQLDVLAVRRHDEPSSSFHSEDIKFTFLQSLLEEYHQVAEYINHQRYDAVIIGYEFGLFQDEYFLCLLRRIHSSRTQIIIILHTLAENLPYQKQALTQQV